MDATLIVMNADELRALMAVARTGSYHAAARSLGFSRSTLRRRIGELEARVGRTLVKPTASGVALTSEGVKVAHRGQVILSEIQAMFAHLRLDGAEPAGELRMGAPVSLPNQIFYPVISLLRTKFPKVRVRLRFFEDPALAPKQDLDAYIDYSELPTLPGWTAIDLCPADEILMANPAYLKRRGTPACIDDLAGHELLTWAPPDREPTCWPHVDGSYFTVEPSIVCTNNEVVHHLAAAGAGIALMPHADMQIPGMSFSENELVPVLPELVRGPRMIRAKVSDELLAVPAFRTLMDITQRFAAHSLAASKP
ncbi:LysR family transcriptional regulator [Haliangium sp.]|uniref:LysR family transcriptional regulator n=1 Tax=Haliangium sp. TaxID=2663208 RepID=UPI003D0D9C20